MPSVSGFGVRRNPSRGKISTMKNARASARSTAAQLTGVHTSVAVVRESRSVAEGDEEVSGGAPGRGGDGERRNGDWLFARLRPSRRPKRKERIVAWCYTTGWYQIDPSNLPKVFNRLLA